jgi:hypothetical protein
LPVSVQLKSVIAGDGHCSSYDPLSEFWVVRVSDCRRKYAKTITQIAVCLMARWLVPYRAFDLRTVKIKLTRLPTVNRR